MISPCRGSPRVSPGRAFVHWPLVAIVALLLSGAASELSVPNTGSSTNTNVSMHVRSDQPDLDDPALCYTERITNTTLLSVLAFRAKRANRTDTAVACIERLLRVDPNNVVGWCNRGILVSAHDPYLALLYFLKAQQCDPRAPLPALLLGKSWRDVGNWPEAEHALRTAFELGADEAETCLALGDVLKAQRRLPEALALYEQSLRARPSSAAYNSLGNVFQDAEQHAQAIELYKEAVRLDPNNVHAWHNMANSYTMDEMVDEALYCYERALAVDPTHGMAFAHWVYYRQFGCLWAERDSLVRRLRERTRDEIARGVPQLSLQAFQAMALPIPARELRLIMQKHAQQFAARVAVFAAAVPPPVAPPLGPLQRPLRVGYVSSAAFNNHVRAHLVQMLFANLGPRVESYCYALAGDDGSSERMRTATSCSYFRDLSDAPHLQAVESIRTDRIDVLWDLNGHTQGARMEIFALRPAPVQAAMVAFAATTGATFMDAFTGDRVSTPPSMARYFTERLLLMPHSYQMNSIRFTQPHLTRQSPGVPSRRELGLPDEGQGIVFCNFNHNYKIDPDIWTSFMQILHRVPGSVLWMLQYPPAAERSLRAEAQARGIPSERLVFSPLYPQAERGRHFARSVQCDLFLDTPLYNAHTTASDALWAGVPLLTLPSRVMAGRVAASILVAAGLGEAGLIVHSYAAYVQRAVQLALDPVQLAALRQRVQASHERSPLFDSPRWARNHARGVELLVTLRAAQLRHHIVLRSVPATT